MLVEVIIPTYYRPEKLKCMLMSLVAQTDGDWGAHVLIDNPDDDKIFRIVEEFRDPRIRWTKMPQLYNDWGHTPREIGKQQSEADYVIMSGDDNYYVPILVEEIRKASHDRPGMIYWDMVHSHYEYAYFKCSPHLLQIDMGAFATRQDRAKAIPLNKTFAADGEFVESFKMAYPFEWIVKIQKVLFVHN